MSCAILGPAAANEHNAKNKDRGKADQKLPDVSINHGRPLAEFEV